MRSKRVGFDPNRNPDPNPNPSPNPSPSPSPSPSPNPNQALLLGVYAHGYASYEAVLADAFLTLTPTPSLTSKAAGAPSACTRFIEPSLGRVGWLRARARARARVRARARARVRVGVLDQ